MAFLNEMCIASNAEGFESIFDENLHQVLLLTLKIVRILASFWPIRNLSLCLDKFGAKYNVPYEAV